MVVATHIHCGIAIVGATAGVNTVGIHKIFSLPACGARLVVVTHNIPPRTLATIGGVAAPVVDHVVAIVGIATMGGNVVVVDPLFCTYYFDSRCTDVNGRYAQLLPLPDRFVCNPHPRVQFTEGKRCTQLAIVVDALCSVILVTPCIGPVHHDADGTDRSFPVV